MDKGKIYAQALYESSPHKSSLLIDDLLLIEKTLEYGLKKILDNPVLGKDRKKSLIEKLFKQYIATETITFSQFLVETNEIQLLPKIRLALERLMNKKDKITKVQVISARELETDLLNDIALNLGKKLKKTLSVKNEIDPELLGGIIIQVGDRRFDNSLKRKIEDLESQLSA